MTETRHEISRPLSSESPTDFEAVPNTCTDIVPTAFNKGILDKINDLKMVSVVSEDVDSRQPADSANITSSQASSQMMYPNDHSNQQSTLTNRCLKHSGRCSRIPVHKHRPMSFSSTFLCRCQFRNSNSVICNTLPTLMCISPSIPWPVECDSSPCIRYAMPCKSLTNNADSKVTCGTRSASCGKPVSTRQMAEDTCEENQSKTHTLVKMCQKTLLDKYQNKVIKQCKPQTSHSEHILCKISSNIDGQKHIPSTKDEIYNKNINTAVVNKAKSFESHHSSQSVTSPASFNTCELPSTSTYVPFFTPEDGCSYVEEQSVEFFTPKYSSKSVSPDEVDQTHHKDTSAFDVLRDIPSSLASLELTLLDENDITYCRTDNGSLVAIGQGVYGGVYLAQLKGNPSKVVIKDFESSISSSDHHIVKEAKILRHLQSTGCVPEFLGISRAAPGKQLALVQEYFGQGVTLGKLLNGTRLPSLPYSTWFGILFQMATGMCQIHSKGVLHNDIQIGNILIDINHPLHKTKFIDFGLATFRCGHKFGSNRDYLLQFDHLAPEVQMGSRTTFKSDVFSLGWIMGIIAQTIQIENDIIWDAIEEMTNEDPEDRPFSDELCTAFKQPLLQEIATLKCDKQVS